jgi:hypothetical protein
MHMEVVRLVPQYVTIALLVVLPVVLALWGGYAPRKRIAFTRFVLSTAAVVGLSAFLAYWPHMFKDIRMDALGVDVWGMNDSERNRNVALEHRAEATELYNSLMGVGWPLQAIIISAAGLAYQCVAWIGAVIFKLCAQRLRG